MAEGETIILSEGREERPWAGGSGAFHQDHGRSRIELGDSGKRTAHGFLKKRTRMGPVQRGGASCKRAHARRSSFLR